MSKIQIWKRITTPCSPPRPSPELYLICQRYKFESESQLFLFSPVITRAVFNMSKIQIWKRITTLRVSWRRRLWLYLICQRYKFESESQHVAGAAHRVEAVFNMSKIQIWKRITTVLAWQRGMEMLYLICQRYKFESESQRLCSSPLIRAGCI